MRDVSSFRLSYLGLWIVLFGVFTILNLLIFLHGQHRAFFQSSCSGCGCIAGKHYESRRHKLHPFRGDGDSLPTISLFLPNCYAILRR